MIRPLVLSLFLAVQPASDDVIGYCELEARNKRYLAVQLLSGRSPEEIHDSLLNEAEEQYRNFGKLEAMSQYIVHSMAYVITHPGLSPNQFFDLIYRECIRRKQ